MILKPFRQHIHGAADDNILSIQFEKIRAFPHHTETVMIFFHHAFKIPVKSVLTFIQKNLAASVSRTVYRHHAVGSIRIPEHFRIPEICFAASLRDILPVQYRVSFVFFIIHAIAHSKTLRLFIYISAVLLRNSFYTGIHQKLASIRKLHCTSGKAAIPVIRLIRCQSRGEILPVQQIFTYCMSPVHGPPIWVIRMILVKKMIFSVIIRKSIGIIQPSHPGREMEFRTILFFDSLFVGLLISARIS